MSCTTMYPQQPTKAWGWLAPTGPRPIFLGAVMPDWKKEIERRARECRRFPGYNFQCTMCEHWNLGPFDFDATEHPCMGCKKFDGWQLAKCILLWEAHRDDR